MAIEFQPGWCWQTRRFCRDVNAEIEQLQMRVDQAETIILAARAFLAQEPGWAIDAWQKDADKFLAK